VSYLSSTTTAGGRGKAAVGVFMIERDSDHMGYTVPASTFADVASCCLSWIATLLGHMLQG
jgi:hypothetical protein